MNAENWVRYEKTKGWVFGLMALCFVACGGGGGDTSGGVPVDTTQPLSLTDTNARAISGLTVEAAVGGISLGSLSDVVIASTTPPIRADVSFNILHLALDMADHVLTMPPQAMNATADASRALVPTSVDCTGGGTVMASWTDADDDNNLSAGDGITLFFGSCTENGLTLNGESDVFILSLVGNPSMDLSWTMACRLNFNSLQATDNVDSVEVIGTLDVTLDTSESGAMTIDLSTEIDLGSGTTSSSFLYFGEGVDFTELTLFSASLQENADGSFTLSSQGTLRSSLIGGTVTFETTQEMTGNDFELNNPSAGELLIIGKTNSRVALRVVDDVVVELDIDAEGDGFDAGDITQTTSWDELSAAADSL